MFARDTKSRVLLCAGCLAALALVGCGGAETRKARHLEKGHTYYAANNFEKARIEFRNALQIAPNDSEARYENGLVDEKLGNPREAAQFYQGAIDVDADNLRARTALARLYLYGGAPERALEIIKPSLVKHPQDPGLLTVRAAARAQLKDPDAALLDAERAVQLAPTSEDAVAVLAGIYKAKEEPEKARALLEAAIKQIPGTVDLRLALAQLYGSLNQIPQVEALLVDLVRLYPKDKTHRLRLAQFYAHLNQPDEAERVLREGIKALPDERDLKVSLIDFLAARRGRDVAAKELERMIAANPHDYELRLAEAQFYEQGKDFPHAEAALRAIISTADLGAAGITARDRLAALKIQTNDVPEAQKLLAEVLDKSPRDNDALILRGNLSLAQKDPKSAIADLRSVLRDQPNAIGVVRTLARAHLANGEPALAEETMRRAVDANPKDAGARLDLAQLLAQLGKPEQAKPVIDELVKQQPDNMDALETQFKVAAATGDRPEAQAAADAMVATHPKLAVGYFDQGAVAESGQRLDDALTLYSAALEMQPETSEPLEAETRVLMKLKRTPEALKRLDATAARFPKVPIALNIKGELLLATQRPADAELAFKSAIERQPKWWVPYRGLAAAQAANNESEAAIATLRSAIAKVDQPQTLQTQMATLLERTGKPDDAMRIYEEELSKNPQADAAANNLAMLLITYKKDPQSLDRAKSLAARFASSANVDFLDTYGWVLYKRGESIAAVAALQTAVSKAPDSPTSLYHLGMAQASAGQADAARDNLARSLKSGKNFSGMDEAKATLQKLATMGVGASNAAPPRT
jgi:tetratricopeptide (TPR) repeat protein